MEKKILFISHDASRTGAPIVFKYHLNFIKSAAPELPFDIYLMQPGVLQNEFAKISKLTIADNSLIFLRVLFKLTRNSFYQHYQFNKLIRNKEYNIVYGNTVVTAPLLKIAKIHNSLTYTVMHVHELDIAIKQCLGKQLFIDSISYIDRFVAASLAVKNMLIHNYEIPESKIYLHYEYIPMDYFDEKNAINLSTPGFNICGSGSLDWRKGIDLFIRIVYLLNKVVKNNDFHFYWIGGNRGSMDFERVDYDIKRLGIERKITIIEYCDNPLQYMQACDVFLLTSREDPFPLVCLEAASVKLPIVCFNNAGGMIEFVDSTNGWVIDYLDLDKIVELFENLMTRPSIVTDKGLKAYEKVQQFNINIGGEKIISFLKSLSN